MRNKFSELFYDTLKTQLILKKILNEREWNRIKDKIFFDFLKDSYFAELKENEVALERANVLNQLQPYVGTYYSQYWIKKNILGLNDTEIEVMQMQIDQEKELNQQKQQIEVQQQQAQQQQQAAEQQAAAAAQQPAPEQQAPEQQQPVETQPQQPEQPRL